ncbi:hypothetical protein CW710_00890 [Candidatus Bathyarchaeota archaeon]|nr:hypothetical protein [Candidatus Bathyarchaeota archaeon]RJS74756.1 MAG: hypothetical protein CW710_00890 [Candidatus Bathyarchaeota archaeon]
MERNVADLLDRVSTVLRQFNEVSDSLKEMRIKLEKLDQLILSGEVSSQTADSLRREYISQLIELLNRYFELRASLEDLRLRCIVELERAKVETGGISGSSGLASRIEESIFMIDDALESLDMDSRLFIASQYAQYLRNAKADRDVLKERKTMYRRFIDSIIESWLMEKVDLESEITELEKNANSIREKLKELWVRFMVGEYDRSEYDSRRIGLEEELSSLDRKIAELRNKVESVDSKIVELTSVVEVEEVEGQAR